MRLFKKREEGQGLVEYALLLVLVAIVVIGILGLMGGQIRDTFAEIIGYLGGGTVSATCSSIPGPGGTINARVTVNVAEDASVSVGGQTRPNCSGSCTFNFNGIPSGTSYTVTANPGGTTSVTCN